MKRITTTWPLLQSFVLGLCASSAVVAKLPAENHEKTAARLQILLASYTGLWKSLPSAKPEQADIYTDMVHKLTGEMTVSSTCATA